MKNIINRIKENNICDNLINVMILIQAFIALIWLGIRFSSIPLMQNLGILVKLFLLIISAGFLCYKKPLKAVFIVTFPFVLQTIFMNNGIAGLISGFMIFIAISKIIFHKFDQLDCENSGAEKSKSNIFKICYVVLVSILVIVCWNSVKMPYSLRVGLMNNFAISHFESDYYFWPEEIQNIIDYKYIPSIAHDRENAKYFLAKELGEAENLNIDDAEDIYNRAAYNKDKFNQYAFKIALASINNRKKDTIITFIDNLQDYLFAPLTFLENCEGYGESITGKRLVSLLGTNPKFSMFYARLSITFLFITISFIIGMRIRSRRKELNTILIIWIGWSALCALFANTAFDYMLFLPIIVVIVEFYKT